MSDSRDDGVHAFDQTNGVVDGLDGREANLADVPDENAASASTLSGSGVEDDGARIDVSTEDAPDLDAGAERRDADRDDRHEDRVVRDDDRAAARDDRRDAREERRDDRAAERDVRDDDAVDDVADIAVDRPVPTDEDGLETSRSSSAGRTGDGSPSAVVVETDRTATDRRGDVVADDAVVAVSADGQAVVGDAGGHHDASRPAASADREAGDPGHVFDQTNGVVGGLEGESDGTAGSDAASAAER